MAMIKHLIIKPFDLLNIISVTETRALVKGTVMQLEKVLLNYRLRVSNVFWKFRIPTIFNFAVIYP